MENIFIITVISAKIKGIFMRELTKNEINQVSGGVLPLAVATAIHIAGQVAAIYSAYQAAKAADAK